MPIFSIQLINRNPWPNNVDNLSITKSSIIVESNHTTKSIFQILVFKVQEVGLHFIQIIILFATV